MVMMAVTVVIVDVENVVDVECRHMTEEKSKL